MAKTMKTIESIKIGWTNTIQEGSLIVFDYSKDDATEPTRRGGIVEKGGIKENNTITLRHDQDTIALTGRPFSSYRMDRMDRLQVG